MARFRQIKNSLSAGEISPNSQGRTDLPIYNSGCKRLENMIPHPMGGAFRRPGSRFLHQTSALRIIPFTYSTTNSYVVEIWSNAVKIITDNGDAFPTVEVATLAAGASYYSETEAEAIHFTQSADVLYLVTPGKKPQRLKRGNSGVFPFTSIGFQLEAYDYINTVTDPTIGKKIPFLDVNTNSSVTMSSNVTLAGATGTLTCSSGSFVFKKGQFFKLEITASTGVVEVTANGTGSAAIKVHKAITSTAATAVWHESAWSDKYGYPSCICFFENRLVYGSTPYQVDTIWGTTVANYDELMSQKFADDPSTYDNTKPFSFQITSQEVNPLSFIVAKKQLIAGTSSLEYLAYGGDQSDVLGKLNPGGNVETYYGSKPAQPVRLNEGIIFVSRDGNRLIQFTFDYRIDSYKPDDLSIYADHMVRRRFEHDSAADFDQVSIKQIAVQGQSYIWAVTTNGFLLSCTLKNQTSTLAWAGHYIGGPSERLADDGHAGGGAGVISACVVKNETQDRLYVVVDRTIAGSVIRTLEVISDPTSQVFLDGWIASSGAASTTYSGFSHLEGLAVQGYYLADSDDVTPVYFESTVSTGTITLPVAAEFMVAGLPYTPVVDLLVPEAGATLGTAQGDKQRIDQITLRLSKTNYFQVGRDATSLIPVSIDSGGPGSGTYTDYRFSGDKTLPFPGEYSNSASVFITSDKPKELGIVSIILRGVTNEV